jgi:hypothetical protein
VGVSHNEADHAQVQRLPYTGKGISAEWKAEVDAMLLQVRARLRWKPAHSLPSPDRTTLPTDCARARNPRALPITLAHPPRRAKGPEFITTALAKRYGLNGETPDAHKYSRLPSAPKIKSYNLGKGASL